jgi:hypothetical protein
LPLPKPFRLANHNTRSLRRTGTQPPVRNTQAFGASVLVQVAFSGRRSLARGRISRAKGRICGEQNREFESRPLRHPVRTRHYLHYLRVKTSFFPRQMHRKIRLLGVIRLRGSDPHRSMWWSFCRLFSLDKAVQRTQFARKPSKSVDENHAAHGEQQHAAADLDRVQVSAETLVETQELIDP